MCHRPVIELKKKKREKKNRLENEKIRLDFFYPGMETNSGVRFESKFSVLESTILDFYTV